MMASRREIFSFSGPLLTGKFRFILYLSLSELILIMKFFLSF